MTKKRELELCQPLNPADYFTLAMDDEIRREAMPGSLCGFAVELDKWPEINELVSRIDEFVARFPLALASLQQQGKQFYWVQRPNPRPVFYRHFCPEGEEEHIFQHATVQRLINLREVRESTAPIEFHLILGRQKSCFLLRWLHPFCDARGAELIFSYLSSHDKAARDRFDTPETEALVNGQLRKYKWWQKIHLFYKAYRYIHQLDCYSSILHGQSDQLPQQLNFQVQRFDEKQTQIIAQQARTLCGLTGTSLYYLGCLMRALQQLEPAAIGEAYCVPYAFNLRKQKAVSPVLGNHVGPLFAQATRPLLENRELLFSHLTQQNKHVIRQQLDYAFLPVMQAASWLSLKKQGQELRQSYKNSKERSSFWFSDIGQLNFAPNSFFGADISGLFHLSQLSSPPGLALLCCHYRKQLTLTYNFIEPLFSAEQIARLHGYMTRELLGYDALQK